MEEDNGEACLSLSLGGFYSHNVPHNKIQTNECRKRVFGLDLSFTLHPKVEPFSTVDGSRSTNDEEEEADVTVSTNSNGFRKKLRLTKEQSSLLEDNFNLHTTLNTVQKQALAHQLNLKPRQVEVWFQNRRARTKLKQTESDCEILKKLCERLSHENKRLKTELHELSSLKSPTDMYVAPPPNFTMCPSCEKLDRR